MSEPPVWVKSIPTDEWVLEKPIESKLRFSLEVLVVDELIPASKLVSPRSEVRLILPLVELV